MIDIVAIKNLASEAHALNKTPPVLSVGWGLQHRCNYDCSYCPPWIHDNHSPHADPAVIRPAMDQIGQYALDKNMKVDWGFTGGEPLINPRVNEILEYTRNHPSTRCVMLNTNGAVPYHALSSAFTYLDNMTVSLHFERTRSELQKTIDMAYQLNNEFKDSGKWLTVTVVCSTGNFEHVKWAKQQLDDLGLKYSLRSVKPNIDETTELVQPGLRQNKMPTVKWDRKAMKSLQWYLAEERQDQYYTVDELEWLKANTSDNFFQNMGYWNSQGEFIETHTDILHTNRATKFNDWICYVGLDSLFITSDGDVYRSSCCVEGSLGNIKTGFTLPTTTVRCPYPICTTLTDIRVRKCRDESLLHLIDDVDQT